MIFDIHFFQATIGDCILIEYGPANKPFRILIDGGTAGTKDAITAYFSKLPASKQSVDLLVVTHVDSDHIGGVLALLEQDKLNFSIGEIWFNSWKHLKQAGLEEFGPVQGEKLSAAILKHNIAWNKSFDEKAVVVVDESAPLVISLPGEMELTLLSPYPKHLQKLKPVWEDVVKKAGLDPGYGEISTVPLPAGIEAFGGNGIPDIEKLNKTKFNEDKGPANGSSIAFLATYQEKKVLFAGDAYPTVILKSLDTIDKNKIPVDLIKLSHHGSKGNTSPALLEKAPSGKYVFSTNGATGHPSHETIAWILTRNPGTLQLIFNHNNSPLTIWDNPLLTASYKYTAIYPKGDPTTVSLLVKK